MFFCQRSQNIANFHALFMVLNYLQCKEQSEDMLEKACITVENTAKGGGVYPEVLFQVAKYWYELYVRVSLFNFNH